MSSTRLKRPSSARRNIKQETFSPFVSGTRLRLIQGLLKDGNRAKQNLPDSILCISGIDSRYNDGTSELINFLLFGFFDLRKGELERSGFDEEVIDDVMFVIRADRVDVYCNPINYHYLLPYVSHWKNVFFHCLTETQYSDEEKAEEFKIQTFVSLTQNCQKVGIPYSNTVHLQVFDKFSVEKWPIIQAYALEGIGGGGFFTMKHDVEDLSLQCHALYHLIDPVSLENIIVEQIPRLERQWTTMTSTINIDLANSPELLTEGKVCEPLQSFYVHGLAGGGGGDPRDSIRKPFVLFGTDTRSDILKRVINGGKSPNSTIQSTVYGKHATSHMVCQAVSPKGPVSCSRSYFLPRQFMDPFQESRVRDHEDNKDHRILSQIYSGMVEGVLSSIQTYTATLSLQKASAVAIETLHKACSEITDSVVSRFLQNSPQIEFKLEAVNNGGLCSKLQEGERQLLVKIAAMSVMDIPSSEKVGTIAGSLMFSESFIDSVIRVRKDDGEERLDGEFLLLTDHIPRYLCWAHSNQESDRKTLQSRLDSGQDDELGRVIIMGEPVTVSTDKNISYPPVSALLYACENGLVIMQPQSGAITLHGSNIKSVCFYDGDASNTVAVLVLEYQSSIVSQLPVNLCHDRRLTLAFTPKTKAYKQIFSEVLHCWKEDTAMPKVLRVEDVPESCHQMLAYLQHQFIVLHEVSQLAKTKLQKAACPLPNTYRFLEHFTASSVGWDPVLESDLPNVLNRVTGEPEIEAAKGNEIVVTILGGVHGSHQEKACDVLSNFDKEQNRYLVVKQPPESTSPFNPVDIQMTLRATLHAHRRRLQLNRSTRNTRVIYLTPGLTDIVDVIQAVVSHPDPEVRSQCRIGSVTVCLDPHNVFMENRYTFPLFLKMCAQGWVNQIVITAATTAPSAELEDIQNMLRSVNSDVSFLLAEKGQVTRSMDIDALLSESNFNRPEKVRARYLGTPGWCLGNYKAVKSFISSNLLRFSLPLDKNKLLSKLRGLKSTLVSHPFKGNVYHIHGRVKLTGENTNPVEFQYTTLTGSLSMTPIAGDQALRTFVVFTGCELKITQLKDWLRECAPKRPERKSRITKKDLTRDEIKKIHTTHHLEPLPAGWFYNGTQYVSFDGAKQDLHPSLDDFIASYLEEKNKAIDEHNVKVEQMLEEFKDLFT